METDLRLGQCYDALDSLRILLHSKSRLLKDKYVNVRHQGPNTRSREFIGRVSSRISVAADRYTAAYVALDALDTDPTAEWRTTFRPLHTSDIRGMSDPSLPDDPDPERASAILARTLLKGGAYPEGNHTLSWIWRGAPTSEGAVSGYNEGLPFPLWISQYQPHTTSSISTRVVKIIRPKSTLAGGGRAAQGGNATDPRVSQVEVFGMVGEDFVQARPALVPCAS